MKKTLILLGLVAASYAGNTSIKNRLGQVKARNEEQPPVSVGLECDCADQFNLPPPGQGVFNGFGQSASVQQSE
jgi:hypothetical protein